jgi:hypothetical protein
VSIVLTGDSDAVLIGGISPWMLGSLGFFTIVLGSVLFAVATWRARSLSRAASALLGLGAVLVVFALLGVSGAQVPEAITVIVLVPAIVAFPGGWVALGISALRITDPAPATFEGASL